MAIKANIENNNRLAHYRERAAHFWALAGKSSHAIARDVWLKYASLFQEMAARREHHLAKGRKLPQRPENEKLLRRYWPRDRNGP